MGLATVSAFTRSAKRSDGWSYGRRNQRHAYGASRKGKHEHAARPDEPQIQALLGPMRNVVNICEKLRQAPFGLLVHGRRSVNAHGWWTTCGCCFSAVWFVTETDNPVTCLWCAAGKVR